MEKHVLQEHRQHRLPWTEHGLPFILLYVSTYRHHQQRWWRLRRHRAKVLQQFNSLRQIHDDKISVVFLLLKSPADKSQWCD